ncbi:MAG: hypothetical protein ABL933_09410 [Methyloglobulus sp.]|nr:hypothetical protein [Methyloglobulus sp.]
MKVFRSVSVSLIVVACFFLSGFKKPTQHYQPKSKPHQSFETSQSQQKVLDLTVPTKDLDSQKSPESLTLVQHASDSETFVNDKSDVNSALELKGNVIMSQEPEAGKTKSADGAGIMINLHH